jgi:PAS domain S-box-containing protein
MRAKHPKMKKSVRAHPALAPLAEIFSKTTDGVLGVDQDHKVALWNEAAERLVGYKATEVVGRPCSEIFAGRDRSGRPVCGPACSLIASARKGEPVQGREVMISTKSGQPIWIHITAITVPAGTPGLFTMVHVFRDVTRQLEMEMLLTKVQSLLNGEGSPPGGGSAVSADNPSPLSALTAREMEVLRLIARGESAHGIAEKLGISHATARNHTQKILDKLGVHTKLEALALAFHYKHT